MQFLWVLIVLCSCGSGGRDSTDVDPPDISPPPNPTPVDPIVPDVVAEEFFSGGDASIESQNNDAFSFSPEAIQTDFSLDATFVLGNQLFRTASRDQGPLLNNGTCQGCHRNDGRGAPPVDQNTPMVSMFLRLSLGNDADNNAIADPIYGTQLQTFGLASFQGNDISAGLAVHEGGDAAAIGEAFAFIEYEPVVGSYPDGTAYELQRPVYKIRDLSYGDFSDGILISPRVSPQMIGLGLLEAIPEADIRALADPDDTDSNGISGRINERVSALSGETELGRFGYKATTSNILEQGASAYTGDMGSTNSIFTDEPCTSAQQACINQAMLEANQGQDGTDITDVELALVEFYSRTLAVPVRRGFDQVTQTFDDDVLRGRSQFHLLGCAECHQPDYETGIAEGSILGTVQIINLIPDAPPIEVLSNQRIWPYTDMLLHDMGGQCDAVSRETIEEETCDTGPECLWVFRCEGLADGRPDGLASGTEWRTAPLWGLGLVQTVGPDAQFLHDGRARTIEEAVLWHGGEAQASLDAFMQLSSDERADVIRFLESL